MHIIFIYNIIHLNLNVTLHTVLKNIITIHYIIKKLLFITLIYVVGIDKF